MMLAQEQLNKHPDAEAGSLVLFCLLFNLPVSRCEPCQNLKREYEKIALRDIDFAGAFLMPHAADPSLLVQATRECEAHIASSLLFQGF